MSAPGGVRTLEAAGALCLMALFIALQLPTRAPHLAYHVHTSRSISYDMDYYVSHYTVCNDSRMPVRAAGGAAVSISTADADDIFFFQLINPSGGREGVHLTRLSADGRAALSFDSLAPGEAIQMAVYAYAPASLAFSAPDQDGFLPAIRRILPYQRTAYWVFTGALAAALLGRVGFGVYNAARLRAGRRALTAFDVKNRFRRVPLMPFERRRRSRPGALLAAHWPLISCAAWLFLRLMMFPL